MRKDNEKVNSFSQSSLIIHLSSAPFWGILTSYLLYKSKEFTPLSMLIGYIIGLLISKTFLSFFNMNDNLTQTEKIKNIYGKFHIVINLLIIILSISIYIFLCYRLSTFLSSQYLVETPYIYFYALILILTFYIANKGIETITRLSVISLFISIIIFLFDSINLIKEVNVNNFLPLINFNLKNILSSSIIYALFSSVPPLLSLYIKKTNIIDKEKYNKMYIKNYTLSFILLFTSITLTIGVYGINLASIFDYPLYTVLKKIEILSFLDSIENVSVILWVLFTINAASIVLSSIFNNIKETLSVNKNKTKYIKIVIMFITFIISLIFYKKSIYTEAISYIKYPVYSTLLLLIIILLTLIISKIKRN